MPATGTVTPHNRRNLPMTHKSHNINGNAKTQIDLQMPEGHPSKMSSRFKSDTKSKNVGEVKSPKNFPFADQIFHASHADTEKNKNIITPGCCSD